MKHAWRTKHARTILVMKLEGTWIFLERKVILKWMLIGREDPSG
jgi:hypothetical protein